jgi:hypothetical protein
MTITATVDASGLQRVLDRVLDVVRRRSVTESAKVVLSDIKFKTARGVQYNNTPMVPYISKQHIRRRVAHGLTVAHPTLSFHGTLLASLAEREAVLGPSPDQRIIAEGNQANTRQPHRNRLFIGAGPDTMERIETRNVELISEVSANR